MTNAFQDGFFINFGAHRRCHGRSAGGLRWRRHPRPDVPGRHHRSPLEDVPSIRSGRLARNPQSDAEPWTGMGADNSNHRGRESAGEFRSCTDSFLWADRLRLPVAPFAFAATVRWASRWTRPLSNRASVLPGSRWAVRTTAVRAGYAIFHDSSWNQGGQGLWENPPYFAESRLTSLVQLSVRERHVGESAKLRSGSRLFLPIITSPPDRRTPSLAPSSHRTSTSNRAWCSSST